VTAKSSQDYCFCTLAIGKGYRDFAMDLINDLKVYAPRKKIVILSDRISDFKSIESVLAFQYKPESVYFYFEKAAAIKKALELYEHCIFIDSDIRIISPVPEAIIFGNGIKAYSCFSLINLYEKGFHGDKSDLKKSQQWQLIEKASQLIDARIEDSKFIWEYCFYVSRHSKIFDMLNTWQKLGNLYELSGRIGGEGEALGLAASKYKIPVDYDHDKEISFFKYRVELWKISQKKSSYEAMEKYFLRYKQLKYPEKPLLRKALDKVFSRIAIFNRKTVLRIKALRDSSFYYS
jgi:glycosyltransferase involved in cell wall biosynthesis